MAIGTVKKIVVEKGFGFISSGGEEDLFFHRSALSPGEFERLKEGMRVEFEIGQSPKGPRAEHVSVTGQ
jgi:CspA family cold shock protein